MEETDALVAAAAPVDKDQEGLLLLVQLLLLKEGWGETATNRITNRNFRSVQV